MSLRSVLAIKHTSCRSNLSSLSCLASRDGGGGHSREGGGSGLNASLVATLVCEVVGVSAVALIALGLAVGDWVDGVWDGGTLGAAVVVVNRAWQRD